MATIFIRSGTILSAKVEARLERKPVDVTARLMGDPLPDREARSQAALERIGGRTYHSWHKGLKTSGAKG